MVEKIDAIGFEKGGQHDNLTAALVEIVTVSNSNHMVLKKSDSTTKIAKSRGKQLVYLLLILFSCLLAFNLYLNSHKKKENKIIEKKITIKHTSKENPKTIDTTSITHSKK